ncbi:Tc toxin subunit A [Pseudomonas sp. PDM04]|uniref:Tc toxin subunit A n=1 Tax=Pseudomonas sp. PDM04 TaxID=2769296 RepID=UPI0017868444|nr:Tc toxin subunit A [Pseudomonas sp. PDM04]MBD9440842.1 virulence plasmid 28 protein [Pseudomonas sp. PDM04]
MSKAPTPSSLEQLFDSVPGKRSAKSLKSREKFIEQGGSVFDMVKMGHAGVVKTFGLPESDAQALLDRATSLAVHTAREYREQRLVRQGPANPLHRTGIRALVDTPTFDDLFDPDWEGAAPVGAPDSSISPAAYFVRLVILARDLEARAGNNAGLIKLDTRRPDLTQMVIDTTSLFQIRANVTLVNEVLEGVIKKALSPETFKDQLVDDFLLEARFPHRTLPFEWYTEQYRLVLDEYKLMLGDVVRAIDLSAPYFKQPGVRGDLSDVALHQSCKLGPLQQLLLTENFLVGETGAEKFYLDNFGSTDKKLQDSVHFCAQTAIDADKLTSLLSIEQHAPALSPNVISSARAATSPKDFGSVYINFGTTPAMGLSKPESGQTRLFSEHTLNRFERMNRILRLSRWLDLPLDECDRLVMAAFNAELRGDIADPVVRQRELANEPSRITNNTLRALGLFQEFRLRFKCTAEQFAALIDEISPYGRGEKRSQFDRLFNAQALFDTPLQLDDGNFYIDPQTRADKRTIDQICSSLGLNQETWRYLARFVAKSYNLRDQLSRSLPVLSSLYRVVLLASFLRISPIELTALLETLSDRGGSEVLQRVFGETRLLVSGTRGLGDVLSVMHAVQTCVQWLQENDLSVSWLVQHVAEVIAPPMATEADVTLLQEIHGRLQPVRLSEEVFRGAGVPANNDGTGRGWLVLLEELVDSDGLVSGLPNDANDYERAVAEVDAAVRESNLPLAAADRVRPVILALVLQARDAQSAVIQESLSVYLSLTQDLVLPVLKWVDTGGVYLLVKETMRALAAVTSGADKINVGDDVLNLLGHLLRRATVVKKLALSSAMLVALTTRRNWQWFGLANSQALSLNTLYQLTLFQRVVIHTGQPAEKLLHYLELVNALPATLTPEDLRLVRDSAATQLAAVLKWSVREVLECILYLSPTMPVVSDLAALDAVLRIRALATHSGLDARAIIRLGSLMPSSDKQAYREAAEHVIESLSESAIQGQVQEIGEVGQSVTHEVRCVNDTLIANVTNQVALIELTLRDLAGHVMPNITVRWSADRPGLLENISITDHEGRAVIRFKPKKGPWMGTVQVKGTYGLAQEVYAPKIVVDCEELTLDFDLDYGADPEEDFLAGGQSFFPVVVRLADKHYNPGIGRTVTFSGQGVMANPPVAITDEDGFARTLVSSLEPIEKTMLLATYSTKGSRVINNITFVDKPSIRLLEVASVAVFGQPMILRAHVVGLAKLPSPNVEVELFADGGTTPVKQTTNDDGIAEFSITAPAAGEHTYTAKVSLHEQQVDVFVAKAAVIHGESAEFLYPVAGAGTVTLLWVTVREEAHNQARLIPQCPVLWTVTGPGRKKSAPVTIATDALGRSTFPFEVDVTGKYTVTASLPSAPTEKRTFALTVVPAIDWTFKLSDLTTPGFITDKPLRFIRGHQYKLEIDLPTGVDLKDARAMLAWDSEFSAKGLGMLFTPATGAYVVIGTETTLSWTVDCQDLRNGAFDLIFYCNRLDQRLLLPGRLDASPPVMEQPKDKAKVEIMPLLYGLGSPSAQIFVFEGRNGALLARTSVGDDGNWAFRFTEPLPLGPHVFSVKQRHIDTTEAWAPDVHVVVDANFAEIPIITSPAYDSVVPLGSWIEGTGLSGTEVRIVKQGSPTTIYAQGMVEANGHWRVQFKPDFVAGRYECSAGLYQADKIISGWVNPSYFVTFEANS